MISSIGGGLSLSASKKVRDIKRILTRANQAWNDEKRQGEKGNGLPADSA
jgi:hypothetical protein